MPEPIRLNDAQVAYVANLLSLVPTPIPKGGAEFERELEALPEPSSDLTATRVEAVLRTPSNLDAVLAAERKAS